MARKYFSHSRKYPDRLCQICRPCLKENRKKMIAEPEFLAGKISIFVSDFVPDDITDSEYFAIERGVLSLLKAYNLDIIRGEDIEVKTKGRKNAVCGRR